MALVECGSITNIRRTEQTWRFPSTLHRHAFDQRKPPALKDYADLAKKTVITTGTIMRKSSANCRQSPSDNTQLIFGQDHDGYCCWLKRPRTGVCDGRYFAVRLAGQFKIRRRWRLWSLQALHTMVRKGRSRVQKLVDGISPHDEVR
jgi:hypothetical protein